MANNCLVTKLNGTVDNDSLKELGTIVVKLKDSEGTKHTISLLSSYSSGDMAKLSVSSGDIYNYGDTMLSNPYDIPTDNGAYKFTSISQGYLKLTNKYALKGFQLNKYSYDSGDPELYQAIDDNYEFDLLDIEYCDKLDSLALICDAKGDISLLSKLTKLETLVIVGGTVSGSIEQLVEGWIDNGREPASVAINIFGYDTPIHTVSNFNVRFGSEALYNHLAYLVFESKSKMYVKSWYENIVQCMGYTDTEIATNTAAGGIWENCTVTKV